MTKLFSLIVLCLLSASLTAQPPKTPATPDVNKMMEDVLNSQNLTEDQKAEMKKMMAAQMNKKDAPSIKIPAKKTAVLSAIPELAGNAALSAYLVKLGDISKKSLPATAVTELEALIAATKPSDLSTLPIYLLMGQKIKSAVYASLKIAAAAPDNRLLQNNCAFVLQQAGYPELSVPVYKLLLKQSQNEVVINNLAQAYLSLGDKENAKKYFVMGLAIAPNSSTMHLGMALLCASENNSAEAAVHINKSIKNGYTGLADEFAEQNNISLKFDAIKQSVPEYFNPNKFKPTLSVNTMEEMEGARAEIKAQRLRAEEADKKASAMGEKYSHALSGPNGLSQVAGYQATNTMTRKALFMVQMVLKDQQDYFTTNLPPFGKQVEETYAAFEKRFEAIQHQSFENSPERCKAHVQNLNDYLQLTKGFCDAYAAKTLPHAYEWCNQLVYWQSFLATGDAYKAQVLGDISAFFSMVSGLSQLQRTQPMPEWVESNCFDYQKDLDAIELEKLEATYDCPLSLKFSLPVAGASVKFMCQGMAIEGGNLGKFSFEKNYATGEFTVAFGLGADANIGVMSLGTKGMVYFTVGKDFMPADMGVKLDAGGEVGVGAFTAEAGVSAAVGISSVNVDASALGQSVKIFNIDALK